MIFDTESQLFEKRPSSNLVYKIYAWMAAGLTLTGLTAYWLNNNLSILFAIVTNRWLFYGAFLGSFVVAMIIQAWTEQLSHKALITLFFVYAFLLGLTSMAAALFIYTPESVGLIFGVTAAMFGFCAFYGYFTESNLTSMGSVLLMAAVGLFFAFILNMILHNATFDYILCCLGVIIFSGLTAYDMQQIKLLEDYCAGDETLLKKLSLRQALFLYLDFVNLFLCLLRLGGRRK